MQPANLHGTAVVLGDGGVLIVGRSGSGKTSLGLELIGRARARGRFARLVADDQLFIHGASGRLLVEAPAAIRGLIEVHGLGPAPSAHVDHAVIDLIVRLVDANAAPRFQDDGREDIGGVHLPSISLAEKNMQGAVSAIFARLRF